MDNDKLIAMLLILMAVTLTVQLAYILLKKRRKKEESEMFRKSTQPAETMADKAHNAILAAEGISSTLAARGVETAEADSIISQAKGDAASRDYASAIERADAAKLVLLRLKRERDARSEGDSRPHPDPGMRPMDRSVNLPREPAREEKSLESLPPNYLQAKFMLTSTRDLIKNRGITEGEAYDYYVGGLKAFKGEDYARALSLAIKAERLLDSGTLTLIGEEKPAQPAGEDEEAAAAEEVFVCPGCDSEVSEDDAFCRECGENLEAPDECPGCGTEHDSADKFCRKCGHKLK